MYVISQEFLALIMSIAAGMKHEGREIKTVKSWKIEDAMVNSVSQAFHHFQSLRHQRSRGSPCGQVYG